MSEGKQVVIIGGGPGGTCAAMLLSAWGFDVTLLEKQPTLGGRTGRLELNGYRFDLGSTMVMMRFVFEELFALAGRRLIDEVRLTRLQPMYRLDFGARGHLDVCSDHTRMRAELERFSPGASPGLEKFLARETQRLNHLYPVLQKSYPHLGTLLDPAVLAALPHVGLASSLHDVASSYFSDPALQLAFSFQAAYLGMSPWNCPGGFGMVPFVEHAWGIDHVQGGVNELCHAMARIAREHGATVRTSSEAQQLVVENGRCVGVKLTSGEVVRCDDVVVDADGAQALRQLLNQDVSLRFSRARLEHLRESCSTYMLYLGLDYQAPLSHHTFFFADDYREEMRRLFETQTLDRDVSLYVCNPSVTDATLAPPGHSALYALVLVPNTRAAIDWELAAPKVRAVVLHNLEERAGLALGKHVRAELSLTPRDWEERFNVSHGAVFGPSHSIGQLLAFRLPNQLPSPDNVFLVGGATNPGSGLPTIAESARITTGLLCQRHGVEFPAPLPLSSLGEPLGAAVSAAG
jgi:phytoene desaturase